MQLSLPDLMLRLCDYHSQHERTLERAVDQTAARLAWGVAGPDSKRTRRLLGAVAGGRVGAGTLRHPMTFEWGLYDQIYYMIQKHRPEAERLVLAERKRLGCPCDPWPFVVAELAKLFTVDPIETKVADDNGELIDGTEVCGDTLSSRLEAYCVAVRSDADSLPSKVSKEIARLHALGVGERLVGEVKEKYPHAASAMGLTAAVAGAGGNDGAQSAPASGDRWRPPKGYVGTKTIMNGQEYQKSGKNPPRTTIQRWEQTKHPGRVMHDPETGENYYPVAWVRERWRQWRPQLRSTM